MYKHYEVFAERRVDGRIIYRFECASHDPQHKPQYRGRTDASKGTHLTLLTSTIVIATSVDAEQSFSAGRLLVNHLQHNISLQTFKAEVALGSWLQSPALSIKSCTQILSKCKMENFNKEGDVYNDSK